MYELKEKPVANLSNAQIVELAEKLVAEEAAEKEKSTPKVLADAGVSAEDAAVNIGEVAGRWFVTLNGKSKWLPGNGTWAKGKLPTNGKMFVSDGSSILWVDEFFKDPTVEIKTPAIEAKTPAILSRKPSSAPPSPVRARIPPPPPADIPADDAYEACILVCGFLMVHVSCCILHLLLWLEQCTTKPAM